jgi:hypothetical protein
MRCDLTCGICKHRWRYTGDSPMQELREHREAVHPEENLGPSPLDVPEPDADPEP